MMGVGMAAGAAVALVVLAGKALLIGAGVVGVFVALWWLLRG